MSLLVKMAIKYVEERGFLYEITGNGEKVLVRSTDSSSRAYLRFTNKTTRPVDIWWRDFRGTRHHYICIDAGAYYDVNTFITHPWEFTDAVTKERYFINNTHIYRPPANLGGMRFRTNWNITIGVRSLRETCMLALALRIKKAKRVRYLELPKTLEWELVKLVKLLHSEVVIDIERA